MRRTGLFGGTFDPIHYGHLLAAESAREAAKLEEVWFIPTFVPPHKSHPGADSENRRRMLETALADCPGFRVEEIELSRQGVSYTIDTVNALHERYQDRAFYWIVGSDMVKDLPNWRQAEELAEKVTFIGLERPGEPCDEVDLPSYVRRKLLRASMPPIGISSTDIRRRRKEGRSIRFMTPEPVHEWIRRHGLYES
ncbi:nicotinate (nicotinamide) nucleotide adenylyltransferase [Cohnella sp. CFH 77786]|uniref:nicotinate (nicotinamide) nucleotide adenylyltransferase n=1 Tax=Cohnella sp. CFH 77786 TaxID=2662265 RepID=UPI001C61043A|nr:nicotinate (nicotinamide) nucleotide adenylyltransferase [Cohnella sp. CFH 77786]MBW5444967.1 nicotinate (nicotinamide) nucleotide adenylyltransferase [Cohnella sp. CFH 77786]